MVIYLVVGLILLCIIEYYFFGSIFYFTEIIFFRHKKKVVALTFDDGPDEIFSKQIMKLLKKHEIKATFFVCGKQSLMFPQLIKAMIAEGHEIGNHSVNHLNMIFKKPSTISYEINETDKILRKLGVKGKIHFRPPFTRMFLITPYILAKLKKKIIMWNIPSKDYKAKSVDEIVTRILKNVKNGGIIVMHDGRGDRSKTIEALQIIIPTLIEKGYSFQTVSEYIN